ncbi:ATP-binding protein [Cognatishimia sp. MH4019]|uniref:ATP-binding protein n=1 Tax=Cognatishimia sp. MH4019 TaxID=2854030 RepID=UPI00351D6854
MISRTAVMLSPRAAFLGVIGFLVVAASYALNNLIGLIALGAGMTMIVIFAGIRLIAWRHTRTIGSLKDGLAVLIDKDPAPSLLSDREGVVHVSNRAAMDRFTASSETVAGKLANVITTPANVISRMQNKAEGFGSAREDIVTRRGHVRLVVHRVGDADFLWRLEDIADRPASARGADGINLPMLTASRSGTILFMNEASRRLLGGRVKSLDRVFRQLPLVSGEVHEVDTEKGTLKARVAVIPGATDRQEIYLLPGDHAGSSAAMSDPASVFEDIPVPLLRINESGAVTACNRLVRDIFDGQNVSDRMMWDLVDGLGRSVREWLQEAFEGRARRQAVFLRVKNASPEVFLQVTLTKVVDDGTASLVALLTDATELKTLEAQFVQSQKMQAIGQLAGGVAHDFNNLLTAISGHCDLLLLRHDQGDEDFGDLTQISQNANRAASLVGQLLAFSRKQNLQPQTMDLRDTLADLTHLLNRLVGEKTTLSFSHDPSLMPIRADKRQLEQVMMNLVVNARDAMEQGGEIRIETEAVVLQDDLSRDRATVPAGRYSIVRVHDQGIGIPADKLTKIFEPFYTTKRTGEGTGLGLSTVYGIIKQTGGFIFVDSVASVGTTFSLYFPVREHSELTARAIPAPVVEPLRARADGVVLLVEDEAPVRAFASRALQLKGFTVIEADCAEAALDLLTDKDLEVDVFVTDVIMPGMDGPSWVKKALEDRPDVRVVFVSGYAEDSIADNQASIPNSVFLPKPFSLTDLTTTVHHQLH